MALSKDGLYWKADSIEIDRQNKVVKLIMKGYKSKELSVNKLQQKNKFVTLSNDFYPFINSLEINQISNLYEMAKKSDTYFNDSIDC